MSAERYGPLPIGNVQLARAVSYVAHKGQVDKGGQPWRVATNLALAEDGPVATAAGFLHDVLEDTSLDAEDLSHLGFPADVIEVVEMLTRWPGDTYDDFIERCAAHPIARVVKLADIADNLDPERLWKPTESMVARYAKAQQRLSATDVAS